jgi:hypothetical protein
MENTMPNDDAGSMIHRYRAPSVRLSPSTDQVLIDLGLLADLAGTWHGKGFNLIGRPDRHDTANVYLELNQTEETLKFDPISTAIPNRGFAQDDIEMYGLTYLQKISDAVTGGALHIEPGIWIKQPDTTAPPETAPAGSQIIARMGSIPHGNAILAEGTAAPFTGAPVLALPGVPYNGSAFPSFNSTPFAVGGPIFADGSSELDSAPPGTNGGFSQYTIANPASATNTRTPYGNTPAIPLPAEIDGIAMQDVVNDPIKLLQAHIAKQVDEGFTFEGTVLNIASQTPIAFGTTANAAAPTVSVAVSQGGGGIENLPFLTQNANSVLVYATFWIQKVSHPNRRHAFVQLQYAQMVLLNFPILLAPPAAPGAPPAPPPNLSWPHVSVATLHKAFG